MLSRVTVNVLSVNDRWEGEVGFRSNNSLLLRAVETGEGQTEETRGVI